MYLMLYNYDSKKVNKKVREVLDMIINWKDIVKNIFKNYVELVLGFFNYWLKLLEKEEI